MTTKIIKDDEIDQLKEITNIGAGNAATALSTMLGQKVEMTVPESFLGGIEQVQRSIGENTDKIAATFLEVHGDIEGAMVMIFTAKSALNFINLMTKQNHDNMAQLDSKDMSALQELGNILLGASATALNKFLDLTFSHSTPDIAIDQMGAIMDTVLSEIAGNGSVLVFKIKLYIDNVENGGDFYYMFDGPSSEKLIAAASRKISSN